MGSCCLLRPVTADISLPEEKRHPPDRLSPTWTRFAEPSA
jgi:hypothetical protein